MGTRTSTWIKRTSIIDNGLGTIKRVESEYHNRPIDVCEHSDYVHKSWWNYSYDLYLEPAYGVRIDRIEVTSIFNGGEPTTRIYDVYNIVDHDNYGEDLRGCISLIGGGEEEEVFEETGESISNENKTVIWEYIVKLVGEKKPPLKLDVIGHNPSSRSLFYVLTRDYEGYRSRNQERWIVYYLNRTKKPVTYSNLVVLDKPYDLNGTEMPEHMWHSGFWSGFDNEARASVTMFPDYDCCANPRPFKVYAHTSNVCVVRFSQSMFYENIPIPQHILIYADCFFAVFRSNTGERFTSDEYRKRCLFSSETNVPMSDIQYGETDPHKAYLDYWKRIPYARLEHQTHNEAGDPQTIKLYAGKLHKEQCTSRQSHIPYKNLDFKNGEKSYTLDKKHRWIENLYLSESSKQNISRFWNYITLVDLENQEDDDMIKDKITSFSHYARFTGYYLLLNDSARKVINEYAQFKEMPHMNQECYPIFKPWAACDILVFDEENDTQSKAFTKRSFDYFDGFLDENYNKGALSEYRKHYYINAHDGYEKNALIMNKFAGTKSPFKLEFYCCHGSREEYDINEYNDVKQRMSDQGEDAIADYIANGDICAASDWRINHGCLTDLHLASECWNSTGPYKFIYIESCFGGGMQTGMQRLCNKNTVCGQNDGWKLSNTCYPIFHYIDSRATHPSYGSSTRSLSLEIFRKTLTGLKRSLGRMPTYSEVSGEFDSKINGCREKIFVLIKDFYETNYDLMFNCLPDDNARQMWQETQDMIMDDLSNNGERYFSMFDWPEKKQVPKGSGNYVHMTQYDASDNFFFPDAKLHRINDGFYGYIKKEIFDVDSSYNREHRKIFKDPEPDSPESILNFDLKRLEKETKKLDTKITRLIKATFGIRVQDPDDDDEVDRVNLIKSAMVCCPSMGHNGIFANSDAEFMKSPLKWMDLHLTSDKDLEIMAEDSMPEPDPGTPDEYDPPYDLTEQNECLAYTGEDDNVPMDEDEEAEWDGIPREYVYAPQN